MLQYTIKIPYVTYFGLLNEEDILGDDFHIMLTLKNNDEDYEVYNSNQDTVIHVDKHITLWVVKPI